MSDEAKKIIAAVKKGVLPAITTQPKKNDSSGDISTPGLDRTTFGLERRLETKIANRKKR